MKQVQITKRPHRREQEDVDTRTPSGRVLAY